MTKRYIIPLVSLAFALSTVSQCQPVFADSSPAPNLYVSPDQVSPGQLTNLTVEIKNTTGHDEDSITLLLQNNSMHLLQASAKINNGADIAYSYYDSNNEDRFDFGSYASKLGLHNGDTFIATIGVNVEAIGTPPTTVGAWTIHMYHWDSGGNLTNDDQPIGNLPFTVTNTPHPTARPLNFGQDNEFSKGINGTGINDPTAIHGLFPAGPLDSLLTLPITLTGQILSAANGTVVTPTTTLLGHSVTFPQSSQIYAGLGSTATGLMSTGMIFFLLLPWLKSLFGRLQRATTLQTHHDDTWGVL